MNSMNCCFVTPRIECASRRSLAALNRVAWISSSAPPIVRASRRAAPDLAAGAPRRHHLPRRHVARAISSRNGTPFASHSKYLAPGFMLSADRARRGCPPARAPPSPDPDPDTWVFSSSDFQIGTMATCTGASRGDRRGRCRRSGSSPSPDHPGRYPHEVFHACSRPPAAVWYCRSNALAKFWPRLCDVPPAVPCCPA